MLKHGVGNEKHSCVDCGRTLHHTDATRCRRCYRTNSGGSGLLCDDISVWYTMPDGVMQRFIGDLQNVTKERENVLENVLLRIAAERGDAAPHRRRRGRQPIAAGRAKQRQAP